MPGFGNSDATFSTSNNNARSTGQNVAQDTDTFHLGNWAALSSIGGGISEARVRGGNDAASEEYIMQGSSTEPNDSDGVLWTRTVSISIVPKSKSLE